eukprot:1137329-Pelagomonas_calceolata.AAC.3
MSIAGNVDQQCWRRGALHGALYNSALLCCRFLSVQSTMDSKDTLPLPLILSLLPRIRIRSARLPAPYCRHYAPGSAILWRCDPGRMIQAQP